MSVALLLLCGAWTPALSAYDTSGASATDSDNQKLVSLENRIFDHPYNDDTIDSRLGRLEKTVYGEVRQGSDAERLSYLLTTVPPQKSHAKSAAGTASPTIAQNPASPAPQNYWQNKYRSRNNPASAPTSYQDQSMATSSNYGPAGGSSAPYGQAAGSPEPPPYANSYNTAQQSGGPGYAPTASAPSAGYGNAGLGQSVAVLEQQTLGETHQSQPLPFRLTQLETAVFGPTADHTGSLYDRIARLNTVVGVGNDGNAAGMASSPSPNYKQASALKSGAAPVMKQNNGHPVLKNVAKTAVVIGVVAGATALTIMAVKGMKGGHHGLDLD